MVKEKIFSWLFLLLPVIWISGFHPNDTARILSLILIVLIIIPYTRKYLSSAISLSHFQINLIKAFIIIYILEIAGQHLIRVYSGGEGYNFAYYTDILNNFSGSKSLSTLLNRTQPYNHLLHHFSPVFYIPALLTLIGIPGYTALILCEIICISLTVFIFYKILVELCYSRNIIFIFIAIFLSNFSLRHALTWSIEDEFFALPLIAASYLFFIRNKFLYVIIFLAGVVLVKENMFLFSAVFSALVFFTIKNKPHYRSIFIVIGVLSITGFILYTFGHSLLFNKQYDHMSRTNLSGCLTDINVLIDKFYYVLLLLLPVLFFPVLNKRVFLQFL